tara:strand:- start:16227 stop:17048 length:822 start_codon:yes stop_codon:yes gene_type:complete
MPELAELRLTADYINQTVKGKTFNKVKNNPEHKWKPLFQKHPLFTIKAKSRGKELIVYLNNYPIRMTMGMSGYFRMTKTGKEHKHSHIIFESTCGMSLSFIDMRRFGKWWPGQEWSKDRGPDPTLDFEGFVKNVKENLHKKIFDKPICEILLNQKYFNGIGNYLRAEIIYRIEDLSPFMKANEAIEKYPDILKLCKYMPELAYVMGGGSIKDWKNPFLKESGNFMKCYGNSDMIREKDGTGRTIWYRPRHQWKMIEDDKWDHYSGLPSPNFYG